MPLQPSNTGIIWQEEPDVSALETKKAGYRLDADGNWFPTIITPFQGAVYETAKGNGNYTLVNIETEWRLVADGLGGYLLAQSGTAVAVLADDGSGGLYIAPVGTATKAGRFLQASDGTIYPVRNDTGELKLLRIGGHFMTYL